MLDHTIGMIVKTYDVVYKRVFILSIDNNEELICSFNVAKGNGIFIKKQLPGAMLVHRKKETNTLYTINSLNALIKTKTNGMLDSNYSIDWNEYQNSMLVTSNGDLKVLKTNLYQIINL
jgi:hypothetical protein